MLKIKPLADPWVNEIIINKMDRNLNIDLLKCVAIFGVVSIHGAFILHKSYFLEFIRDIYRFAVPCFIIIWSFLFEISFSKKSEKDRYMYIWQRSVHLLRVFFLWSVLYFFINVDWHNFSAKDLLTKYFSGYGWAGQYFFIILFQLLLLYPILRKINDIRIFKIGFPIAILMLYYVYGYFYESLPINLKKLGDRPFLFWIPYVLLGVDLARNKVKSISSVFLFSPILIALEFLILTKLKLKHSFYITPIVLLTSILFCIALLSIKEIKIPEKFKNFIEYIGKNTLIIFVSNPLLILLLEKLLNVADISVLFINLPSIVKTILSIGIVMLIFAGTLGIVRLLEQLKLKKVFG